MDPRSRSSAAGRDDVLDSWKAIASYLNREVRTVMRWEHCRQLPVHRLPGGGRVGVYARKSELDAWRDGTWIRPIDLEERFPAADSVPAPSVAILPFANLTEEKENDRSDAQIKRGWSFFESKGGKLFASAEGGFTRVIGGGQSR
jgi:hypothetical protein